MNWLAELIRRVYIRLVQLYPPAYYQDYGPELLAVFNLALDDCQPRGPWGILFFAGRELRDLPGSILRQRWNERKQNMKLSSFPGPVWEEIRGRQWILFILPFSMVILASLADILFSETRGTGVILVRLLVLGILAASVAAAAAGLWKRLPAWSLPNLGLVVGILNIAFMLVAASRISLPLQRLSFSLTGSASLLYPATYIVFNLLQGLSFGLPSLILLLALVVLSAYWPALYSVNWRVHQDWSILSFLIYNTLIISPIVHFDDYQYYEPYQLLCNLLFALGIGLYLLGRTPGQRLGGLIAGMVLMQAGIALGLNLIYPLQDPRFNYYPRWYASLLPVVPSLMTALILALPAWLVKYLPVAAPPEAA